MPACIDRAGLKMEKHILPITIVLFSLVLAFDLYSHLGIAAGIAYIPLVACGLWFPRNTMPLVFAAVATVLIILGYFASPHAGVSDINVLVNRGLSILSVWIVAVICLEQKRTRSELSESEQQFRLAMEHSAIGMALVAPDGKWLKVNHALTNMLGYTQEELLTIDFQTITHPDDLDEDLQFVTSMLAGWINHYQMEKRYLHKQGHIIHALLSVSLVRNPDNSPACFISQIIDQSARKRAIDDLKQSNRELEQFAYIASHDLQEPLRMVTSYVDLLARRYQDKLDQDASEFIQFAVDGCKRMSRLIQDLLEFSRVGTHQAEFVMVDSQAAYERAIKNLKVAIEESHCKITCTDLPNVHGDANQLTQLLQNLIGNAIKYRHPDRECQISVEASVINADKVQFNVRDNGIGIEQKHFEKIFDIFKRLHGRNEYEGTGIGLAICKRIVESHQGKIWPLADEQQGSCFCFTLQQAKTSQ